MRPPFGQLRKPSPPKGAGGLPKVARSRAWNPGSARGGGSLGYQRREDGGRVQNLLLRGLQGGLHVRQLEAGLPGPGLAAAGTPAQRLQLPPGGPHSSLEARRLRQEGFPERCREPAIRGSQSHGDFTVKPPPWRAPSGPSMLPGRGLTLAPGLSPASGLPRRSLPISQTGRPRPRDPSPPDRKPAAERGLAGTWPSTVTTGNS